MACIEIVQKLLNCPLVYGLFYMSVFSGSFPCCYCGWFVPKHIICEQKLPRCEVWTGKWILFYCLIKQIHVIYLRNSIKSFAIWIEMLELSLIRYLFLSTHTILFYTIRVVHMFHFRCSFIIVKYDTQWKNRMNTTALHLFRVLSLSVAMASLAGGRISQVPTNMFIVVWYHPTVDCCVRTAYSHTPFTITVICHHIFHIFESVLCIILQSPHHPSSPPQPVPLIKHKHL